MMFDNPMATVGQPPRPTPRPKVWVMVAAMAVLAGLLWMEGLAPRGDMTVVSSACHLRQVEVLRDGRQTVFLLRNAGFRLRHHTQVIAVVYGVRTWAVDWLGADDVRLEFPGGYSYVVMGHVQGIKVEVAGSWLGG